MAHPGDLQPDVIDLANDDEPADVALEPREGVQSAIFVGLLLPWQRAMLDELLEEDGLCVLAAGLGMVAAATVLLRLQQAARQQAGQQGVLLVIGAHPWQRDALQRELTRLNAAIAADAGAAGLDTAAAAGAPPAEVTADVPSQERTSLYASHAVLFVTTRILVVDLLSSRVRPADIAGLLVLNAHRRGERAALALPVTDTSGEGFAVRLFKAGAPAGCVRAFSDVPAAFCSNFSKASMGGGGAEQGAATQQWATQVEKAMKALHVRKLYLWPRFHATVRADLEARPPELVELAQPMTSAMCMIYDALTDLLDACVKELRLSNKLDTSDLTLEQARRAFACGCGVDGAGHERVLNVCPGCAQGLFRSFDDIVRRQLNPIWHMVSPKTRQIVADLRTLRMLSTYLLRFDPVTFLAYLDTLRATEGINSIWLFQNAAHTIFEAAKSRVYALAQGGPARGRKRKAGGGGEQGGDGPSAGQGSLALEAVLETMPKWELLREVMQEIQQERQALLAGAGGPEQQHAQGEQQQHVQQEQREQRPQQQEQGAAAVPGASPDQGGGGAEGRRAAGRAPVLVVCADSFTSQQLREVLKAGGPGALLRRLYVGFLQRKLEAKGAKGRRGGDAGAEGASGSVPAGRMMGGYRPGEEQALLREAKVLAPAAAAAGVTSGVGRGGGRGRGRGGRGSSAGRGAGNGGRGRGRSCSRAAEDTAAEAAADALHAAESIADVPEEALVLGGGEDEDAGAAGAGAPSSSATAAAAGASGEDEAAAHPLLEGVELLNLESQGVQRLWEAEPSFVVMYDPDVAFTRALELYRATRPGRPLRVYLLRYEDSVEMDKYQAVLVREREAFEQLIRTKEIMILPISQGPRPAVNPVAGRRLPAPGAGELPALGAAANALTRRAGGRRGGRHAPTRVVVDVREFMSSLPSVLHQQGLEVGDYVLSPEMCVERKSIADLKGSLNSGRLYHQAEAMTKHYRTPLLLIEFDGDKAFALQARRACGDAARRCSRTDRARASSEIGDDISLHSLMSRLTLLCLHFPRLRLIWSRSLHATADLFQQLKANQDEPDPVAAATVGVPLEAGAAVGHPPEAVVNQAAQDVLRRLPGVTDANWRAIARQTGSLADLARMSPAELEALTEGQAAASKLHAFLHQDCAALFAGI
eukprot:scaffold1.g5233.t1